MKTEFGVECDCGWETTEVSLGNGLACVVPTVMTICAH